MTVPVVRFTVQGRDPGHEAPSAGSPGRPYVVVYDGQCNVCRKLVGVLTKWDRDGLLEIVPAQKPGVTARFPWIPARAYMESVQVVRCPDGRTWQGAAAIEQLLDILPKGRLTSWIFSIPLVRPLAEKLYRWFARNRYHLGCGEHCQVRAANLQFPE